MAPTTSPPTWPAREPILTILPHFFCLRVGITSREQRKVPFKLTSRTLSHISSDISATVP